MSTKTPFCIALLEKVFASRKETNPSYSLRSFARDLKIDSSNLSSILKKRRGVPFRRAHEMAKRLGLSIAEEKLFVLDAQRSKYKIPQRPIQEKIKKYLIDEKYHRVISEWEYYALLSLMRLSTFRWDTNWISKRLSISKKRAHVVKKDLIDLGLIEEKNGNIKRSTGPLGTSEDIKSDSLRKSHERDLHMAIKKIQDIPVQYRDFSSLTMAIDIKKIPKAKALIRDFQERLQDLLEEGDQQNEVYLFLCQLFPLSNVENSI